MWRVLSAFAVLGVACATPTESTSSALSHAALTAACHGSSTLFLDEEDLAVHRAHGDATGPCTPLTETLVPPSYALIDCGGRALLPADPERSQRAIFLWDVRGVTIRDCVVPEGAFELAIDVARGGGHVIEENELHARDVVIQIVEAEDVLVKENRLVGQGDWAVWLKRGARHNHVVANHIRRGAIVMYDHPEAIDAVFNYLVNGRLYQVPMTPTSPGPEDNVAEDNDIDNTEAGWLGLGNAVRSHRNLVRHNRVTGGEIGIIMPGFWKDSLFFQPGTCAGPQPASDVSSPRWCRFEDAPRSPRIEYADDCNIPGYDDQPIGPCVGTWALPGDGRVVSPRFEGNTVEGADTGAALYFTVDVEFVGNRLSGGSTGMLITHDTLETAKVTGNRIAAFEHGIRLEEARNVTPAMTFTGNDIVDTRQPLYVEGAFTLRLDGNHWGRGSCPAFLPIDSNTALVGDCRPFAVPVADDVPAGVEPCDSVPDKLRQLCR